MSQYYWPWLRFCLLTVPLSWTPTTTRALSRRMTLFTPSWICHGTLPKVSEPGPTTGCFFLSGPPTMQNNPPNQMLGTPSFGSQNGPLKLPPTYLGLGVPNLQILRIGDIPGMSTNSIVPFQNVCWPNIGELSFSCSTKLVSLTNFCRLAQLLFRVRLTAFF